MCSLVWENPYVMPPCSAREHSPPSSPTRWLSLEGKQLWKHELNSVTGVSGKGNPLGMEDKRGEVSVPLAFCPPQIRTMWGTSPCHFFRPSNSQRWLRQNQEGISHKGTLNPSLLGTLLLKHLPPLFPPILQDGCWEIPRAETLERGSGTEPTLQVPWLWEDVPVASCP